MKSEFDISSDEATRPPTSTLAPLPNTTPLGFKRKTFPFACSAPWITDVSLPVTRFSAAEDADGWLNRTISPAVFEKLRQSMMTLSVNWFTVVRDACD